MKQEDFENLVEQVLQELPARLREKLENVIIEVRPRPTRRELRAMKAGRGTTFLGLYQGVPLTERSHDFGGVMPDRISIFQEIIEAECASNEEVADALRTTLIHELGHYFGLDDADLEALEGE